MNKDRKYLAVSIKHSYVDWKTKEQVLYFWGYKRTQDNEPRCFCDYTLDPDQAELYSLDDWKKYIDSSWMKIVASVPLVPDCRKVYRDYDTVLIEFDEIKKGVAHEFSK